MVCTCFYLFLFEGIGVIDQGLKDDDNVKMTVCNIPKDIVYATSNGWKFISKHVRLGLELRQATRSEALVDLFHRGHNHIRNWYQNYQKNGYSHHQHYPLDVFKEW